MNFEAELDNEEKSIESIQSNVDVDKDFVYHYTSKSKARKIRRSKLLLPSINQNSDCLYGIGIYFTSLCPNNTKS